MHKSRLGAIVIDCQGGEFDRDCDFWSRALGRGLQRSDDPDFAHYASLESAPEEAKVLLQKVEHPSRVHLDIKSDDVDAEVERLKQLGATEVARVRTWCVMQAPSGHRFCVVPQDPPDFAGPVNEWT